MKNRFLLAGSVALVLCLGCRSEESGRVQGYVEGEYTYIASQYPGRLKSLSIQRGDIVQAQQVLFELESEQESALAERAVAEKERAEAEHRDARKGLRPSEIDALRAQISAEESAEEFAESELVRQQKLFDANATSKHLLERARAERRRAAERLKQLRAELETAQLGARTDRTLAAEAQMKSATAALTEARWVVSEKTLQAPESGQVFDVFYRPGEFVSAGSPVVSLLAPRNIKVRVFVPETTMRRIRVGAPATVHLSTRALPGTVTFISPKAEFTPPVLYSRENRSKLMYMIELRVEPDPASQLTPGQPLDVEF